MKKKKIFTTKMSNAIAAAAPMSVWRKGCAGKGEPRGNAIIVNNKYDVKESE